MASDTITKIKLSLRTGHSKLDEDVQADIDACLADLKVGGIIKLDPTDPLIFNAIKLYCKSLYPEDPGVGAEWKKRYDDLKASLSMAEGYGWEAESSG